CRHLSTRIKGTVSFVDASGEGDSLAATQADIQSALQGLEVAVSRRYSVRNHVQIVLQPVIRSGEVVGAVIVQQPMLEGVGLPVWYILWLPLILAIGFLFLHA